MTKATMPGLITGTAIMVVILWVAYVVYLAREMGLPKIRLFGFDTNTEEV